ncbi:DUF6946 family protein [Paenibacillus sp. WC2504]|uniref:DUF6946 family protein n=1 Tax=Paenibacillus sp. WC2504 TaxID=3461403 RepID=UPI004045603F
MKTFYFATGNLDDWKKHMANPERQWKKGYSAYELANVWTQTNGFPDRVQELLDDSQFKTTTILFAFPEYQVYLNNQRAPSQNDIFILGKLNQDLVIMMVEGKVEEPFGKTVKDWLHESSEGKRQRLTFLKETLQITDSKSLDNIRYQLLHRTASALIEAKKLNANKAIVLVHSFSATSSWIGDYHNFLKLFNLHGECNQLSRNVLINGVELYFGWVSDNLS